MTAFNKCNIVSIFCLFVIVFSCSTVDGSVRLNFASCKQSSTYKLGSCKKAIDKATKNCNYPSVSHTLWRGPTVTVWWEGYFAEPMQVQYVKLWNIADVKLQDRLTNFKIVTDGGHVCAEYKSSATFLTKTFRCNALTSKIKIVKTGFVELCEVEVFGIPHIQNRQRVPFVKCSQSSTYELGTCEKAMDKNTKYCNYPNVSHTVWNGPKLLNFWEGRFAKPTQIKFVKLWNIHDTKNMKRLTNFKIVTDGGHVCAEYNSIKPFAVRSFVCNAVTSSVRIQKTRFVELCEVEVFGDDAIDVEEAKKGVAKREAAILAAAKKAAEKIATAKKKAAILAAAKRAAEKKATAKIAAEKKKEAILAAAKKAAEKIAAEKKKAAILAAAKKAAEKKAAAKKIAAKRAAAKLATKRAAAKRATAKRAAAKRASAKLAAAKRAAARRAAARRAAARRAAAKRAAAKKRATRRAAAKRAAAKKRAARRAAAKKIAHRAVKQKPKNTSASARHAARRHAARRHAARRHAARRHSARRHAARRHATRRHSARRHAARRHAARRHSARRHSARRHAARRHSARTHSARRHSAKRHSTRRHATRRHAARRHAARRHSAKKHAARRHAARRHSAKKHAASKNRENKRAAAQKQANVKPAIVKPAVVKPAVVKPAIVKPASVIAKEQAAITAAIIAARKRADAAIATARKKALEIRAKLQAKKAKHTKCYDRSLESWFGKNERWINVEYGFCNHKVCDGLEADGSLYNLECFDPVLEDCIKPSRIGTPFTCKDVKDCLCVRNKDDTVSIVKE